jgi:glycosyltransferase involved in cell wall biosynthesis
MLNTNPIFHCKKYLTSKNQEYINEKNPLIAIIAPPLDTVPSPSGNAIYTLVEQIAANSSYSIIVFSIKPETEILNSTINNQIVYLPRPPKSVLMQKLLGYSLTKKVFGFYNIHYQSYYNLCYKMCTKLGIRIVMQQERIDLLGKNYGFNGRIILHVHAVTNELHWKKINSKVVKAVFVSHKSMNLDNLGYKKYKKQMPGIVIYNGINLKNYETALVKESEINKDIKFLYVGRLNESKGILELMKALNELEAPNVKLNIIGDIKFLTNPLFIQEFYYLLHSNSNIEFIGIKSQSEIDYYYNQSDFLICPSIGSEGLPKVVMEAVVMGKPVIASNRGGITELVTDRINGVIIKDPVNYSTIKDSLVYAIFNKKSLQEHASFIKEEMREKYSLQTMIKNIDLLFTRYLK